VRNIATSIHRGPIRSCVFIHNPPPDAKLSFNQTSKLSSANNMSSGGDIVAGPAVEASAELLEPHMKSTYRSYKYLLPGRPFAPV